MTLIAAEILFGLAVVAYTVNTARFQTAATDLRARIANASAGAFGMWLAAAAVSSSFPVLQVYRADLVGYEPGRVHLMMFLEKIRDCRLVKTTVLIRDIDGRTHSSRLEWNRYGDESKLPVGGKFVREMDIDYDPSVVPSALDVRSEHDCGSWNRVLQTVGSFIYRLPDPLGMTRNEPQPEPTRPTGYLSLPLAPAYSERIVAINRRSYPHDLPFF